MRVRKPISDCRGTPRTRTPPTTDQQNSENTCTSASSECDPLRYAIAHHIGARALPSSLKSLKTCEVAMPESAKFTNAWTFFFCDVIVTCFVLLWIGDTRVSSVVHYIFPWKLARDCGAPVTRSRSLRLAAPGTRHHFPSCAPAIYGE